MEWVQRSYTKRTILRDSHNDSGLTGVVGVSVTGVSAA